MFITFMKSLHCRHSLLKAMKVKTLLIQIFISFMHTPIGTLLHVVKLVEAYSERNASFVSLVEVYRKIF
jgi:hypothetical protein